MYLVFLLILMMFSAQVPASGYYNLMLSKKTPNIKFSTTSKNILAYFCSSVFTLRNNLGISAANVTSPLTINLSGTGGITFYSDSNCSLPITSVTIATGQNSSNFYFLSNTVGTGTITTSAASYLPVAQSETLSTNPYIWTGGGGDANWTTAANWSGGSFPGSSNVAVFNDVCVSNCSPVINTNTTVGGLRMASTYAGTITQNAGVTLNVRFLGWAQLAGTFSGGDSQILLESAFTLAGGTLIATTGNFIFNSAGYVRIAAGATFNPRTGTCNFSGTSYIDNGGTQFYNLIISTWMGITSLNNNTIDVLNDLIFASTSATNVNSGILRAFKNVFAQNEGASGSAVVQLMGNAAGQTVTGAPGTKLPGLTIMAGSNNVTLSGYLAPAEYTVISAGTLTTTGSTLIFGNPSTITPGSFHYNNVIFGGWSINFSLVGTLYVDGDLSFSSTATCILNSGTIILQGNLTNINNGHSGTTLVRLIGNPAGQTITGNPIGNFPKIEIDAGAHNVTLSGAIKPTAFTMISAGTLTTAGSTLILTSPGTVTPGNFHYNNVTFDGWAVNYDLGGATFFIDGNLSFGSTGAPNITNGVLSVTGNINSVQEGSRGNVTFDLRGSSNKTITLNGIHFPSGNVNINMTGGATVEFLTPVNLSGATQTVNAITGNINMNGNNFSVKNLSLNGNSVTKGGGVLTVNGSVSGAGSLYGGTVAP
jgi:hypothetical protein